MTDLFHDWKQNRFVVVDRSLIDEESGITVLLTDLGYWVDRTDEIMQWCKENNAVQRGLTITMPSESELLLFCLKWV